jgi:LacI family transcriptional regulator
MATIRDVAELAGVSTATVSHVLNKTRKVNPDTLARVEAAIEELNYRPNAQARSLKTGLSYQIGVINISSIDPFFSAVLHGLERAATAEGYGVLVGNSEFLLEQQESNIDLLIDKGIDGMIINSPIVTEEFYALLRELTIPCIMLQFYDESLPVDFIHPDDLTAAYNATSHLLDLNHTRVACIAGFAYRQHSAYQRGEGYRKALQDRGLPFREDYFVVTDYSIQQGYDTFTQLRALPDPPTAFIAYSDELAMGALRAAADLGLSVPGDVSIIGFDDLDLASYTIPRLTTVFQEKALLGQLAFERLRSRIDDPSLPPQRTILPTRLIVRESCGPAPGTTV